MTWPRAVVCTVTAGVLAGEFFNGADVWGAYLALSVVLLAAAGVVDVRSWWKATR